MQSSRPTAPVLRKACLAAALAVATGSAFALDAGGFMRTAADTASPPPANSAPGMPGARKSTATRRRRRPATT